VTENPEFQEPGEPAREAYSSHRLGDKPSEADDGFLWGEGEFSPRPPARALTGLHASAFPRRQNRLNPKVIFREEIFDTGAAQTFDRLQAASREQDRGSGIHNQQEEKIEDVDELDREVAFWFIQY
jgi:hypothetical protein